MIQSFSNIDLNISQKIPFFSVKEYLNDQSPIPADIISPRILTKRGLLVFGGPPENLLYAN